MGRRQMKSCQCWIWAFCSGASVANSPVQPDHHLHSYWISPICVVTGHSCAVDLLAPVIILLIEFSACDWQLISLCMANEASLPLVLATADFSIWQLLKIPLKACHTLRQSHKLGITAGWNSISLGTIFAATVVKDQCNCSLLFFTAN